MNTLFGFMDTAISSQTPQLSLVVTSRNDGHGGDMLKRMQIFLNAWVAQCLKHEFYSELIFVEWNPPEDRPPLKEALVFPKINPFCSIRIITVPAELHRKFKYSDRLPLFQMIAKNVGIFRARGRFVLSTNVDLIFSDELMLFFKNNRLQPGILYRSDRIDVENQMEEGWPLEKLLDYCKNHVLRAARVDGIWETSRDSFPRTVEQLKSPRLAKFSPFRQWVRDIRENPEKNLGSFILNKFLGIEAVKTSIRFAYIFRAAIRELWVLGYHYQLWKFRQFLSLQQISDAITLPVRQIPLLHTNACGDFMLMAKDDWLKIGGHPEFEMYSLHIDSLTVFSALQNHIQIEVLSPSEVHYHIEHGGGWTPESERSLYRRMFGRGIPIITSGQYMRLAEEISKGSPLPVKNTWGLQSETLPEITPEMDQPWFSLRIAHADPLGQVENLR